MDLFPAPQGGAPFLQQLGKWAAVIYTYRPMIQMEIHLILSALFPIIIGSHASLKRPSSAAPPENEDSDESEDSELEDKVDQPLNAGLTPSDAIIFPITAGLTLGGLYFVIVWMDKADLVNTIMNAYLSVFGIFGVGRLAADALNVLATFIFPSVWSCKGKMYYIDPLLFEQVSQPIENSRTPTAHENTEDRTNPLPGFLSKVKFSSNTNKKLWTFRALIKNHWVFRAYLHGIFKTKKNILLSDVIGLMFGIATVVLYNTGTKVWWLTNILGINFCYGILQILSPTTFWTGTLVLSGLFIYDIIMVFYTPMMITVAKSLQAPIMLVIPGPAKGSMLGLGDIALPGMVMAMALRFDLYLHYMRKQKRTSVNKENPSNKNETGKVPYIEATGVWGERYWTAASSNASTAADGARFSKVYFKASIVGYIIAMLVTMAVMHHFKHGQPALLYLVPGVLGALWGTAWVRGELTLMWEYSEDGEWGFEDEKKAIETKEDQIEALASGKGNALKSVKAFTAGFGGNGMESSGDKSSNSDDKDLGSNRGCADAKRYKDEEHAHHVFLVSLTTAPQKKEKREKVL